MVIDESWWGGIGSEGREDQEHWGPEIEMEGSYPGLAHNY